MNARAVLVCWLLLALAGICAAQLEEWQWVRSAGGSAGENCQDVTTDFDGNCYLTGEFTGTAQFGSTTLISAGGTDVFIAKLSPRGLWLWTVRAGGMGDDWGTGISADAAGNAYVTGYFNGTASFGFVNHTSIGGSDLFIAKLGPTGNWLWAQSTGTYSNDSGLDIAIDAAGNSYLCGHFANDNVMVAKYDSQGINQGFWSAADASVGNAINIACDSSGNLVVTGNFSGDLTLGTTTLTSNGASDIFAARMVGWGNWVWADHAGGGGDDYGGAIALDGLDNSYVTGYFSGGASFGAETLSSAGAFDVFVWKIAPSGVTEWATQAGGAGLDAGMSIAEDNNGYFLLSGCVGGTAVFGLHAVDCRGGLDAFVARFDSAGHWLGAYSAGGTGVDISYGGMPDNYGNCYLAGIYYGSAFFGTDGIVSVGDYDIFVCKLGPSKPLPPQNLDIYRWEQTALLVWDAVTQDIYGRPLTPDYYFVYRSQDNSPAGWHYLGMSLWNVFYHDYVMAAERNSFYRVTAVNIYSGRGDPESRRATETWLREHLREGMTPQEVSRVLEALKR